MVPAIPREGFTTAINSRYTLDMANHIKLASPLYLRNLGLDASSCIAQAATIECATSMMTYMDAYGVPVVVVSGMLPLIPISCVLMAYSYIRTGMLVYAAGKARECR